MTEEVYRKQIRPVIQTGATAMNGISGTPAASEAVVTQQQTEALSPKGKGL
ncbi:hypothetical protein [Streptomyces sp. YS-3]|uniref:hypothetical protein n=1 Tax=Streptomyces sp. YS-3 TaxID=3381352 RepID=UPI003862C5E7